MEIKKLRELPGFKEELKDIKAKLKQLENTKETVSENTYKMLKEKYERKIDNLI